MRQADRSRGVARREAYRLSRGAVSVSALPVGISFLHAASQGQHFGGDCGSRTGAKRSPGGGDLVKYMLLIYGDEQVLDDIDRERCYVESAELAQDLHSAGQYLGAAPLHPTSKAVSVRVRESKRLVTDGPFAETREQLGGDLRIRA